MNWEVISAAFISHQGANHQREYDNDDDALFALGKNKGPREALHLFA
jgi:hypothetical protein